MVDCKLAPARKTESRPSFQDVPGVRAIARAKSFREKAFQAEQRVFQGRLGKTAYLSGTRVAIRGRSSGLDWNGPISYKVLKQVPLLTAILVIARCGET